MKKRRLLSVLTSAAILATTVASSMVSTVFAGETVQGTSTDVITLKPEKSSFTEEEVSAGKATSKVSFMFDSFDDADEVTMLLAKIKGDSSHITFQNLTITTENAITCKNDPMYDASFDFTVSGTDPEDTSSPTATTGFFIQNDGTNPFIKNDLTKTVATFDVIFDSTTPAGTYNVSLDSGSSLLSGTQGTTFVEYINSIKINAATFTIGGAVQPTTAAPTTQPSSEDTTASRTYIGDCKIWADEVVAEPGATVTVNMYADTNKVDIRGFEARAIYDTDMLTLTDMKMGKGFAARPTINKDKAVYVLASATNKVKNDPTQPFAVLTFTVSENAKAGDVYPIDIQGSNGAALPVVNVDNGGEGTTYLTPLVTKGSVTISGETTPTTPAPTTPAPTTSVSNEDTTASREYIGTCDIWADKVTAEPGATVKVNMYADTKGVDIRGFEARAIYDTDMLTLTDMKMGKGFAARPTINKDKAVYVLASATNKVKNDPTQPFAVLTFTVSENAKAGDVYEIDIQGSNGAANPVVNVDNGGEGTTYLSPNVTPGSITITGETSAPSTTVTTKAPETTVTTTTVTTKAPDTTVKTDAPSTDVSILTSIKVVEVTSIKEGEVTSIKEVEVTKPVEVTSIKVVEVTTIVEKPGTVIATVTSLVPVEVTSIKEVEVTKQVEVTSIKEVEVTKPVEVEVTKIVEITTIVPYPGTVIATVTSIVPVEVTSVKEVTSIKEVTSLVTVTSIVNVPSTVVTTTNGGSGSFEIELTYDGKTDSDQWYHSDNVEFFKDGIVIKDSNGNDVTADAVISFATTPGEVYDGKNFDYEVDFTVEINGETLTGSLPVKIGPRGDSNMSGKASADIYDAIIIAKFILPKPAADIPAGSFQEFLADNNEDGVVNIYDAINVAKLILPANNGDWSKVSKDYSKWIKD